MCITLRFADFSLREGAERFLCDSARFCRLLLRIWRWPDQRVASLGGGVYESAASETRLTRRAGLRASIEGGAPAPEDHRHHSDREPGSYKRAGRVISGVTYFAFASDLKDAGIDSPTGRVAGNVVKGILEAYRTQRYLLSKRLADYTPITRVTLLRTRVLRCGEQGIQDAIALVR